MNKIQELKKILDVYRKSFDLIIDFQGLLKSAILSFFLRGYTIGFHKRNLKEPLARFFYHKRANYFSEERHVIHKNLHLLSLLNISDQEIRYPLNKIPISGPLKRFMDDNLLLEHKYLILNIGGGWSTKILETAQYICLAKGLDNRYKTIILWGNEKERKIAEEVSKNTRSVISPLFNFSELIQFIDHACLIITSDTLAMHIADMVDTPSVGIFGPTSPQRNGSLLKKSFAVYNKMPCSFCYKKKCDTIECLKQINIEEVIKAVDHIHEKCN